MRSAEVQSLADLVASPFAAQLVGAMPEPAIIVGPDERAAAANEPALQLLPGLRVGDPFVLGLRAPDVIDARRRVMASGEAETVQWSERVPVERLFDVTVAPLATAEGEVVRLSSHKVALKRDEADATAKIENAFRAGGLATPALQEVLAKSGVDPARARTLLQLMLRDQRLVRVSDELVFHASAMQSLRALLSQKKGQRFAVPEFKDWTGVSRKYAIPLLEYLDRERITRRDGDSRVVL